MLSDEPYLDDGSRLPERDVIVGIYNGRNAAVWVDIGIGFLLEAIKFDPRRLVR